MINNFPIIFFYMGKYIYICSFFNTKQIDMTDSNEELIRDNFVFRIKKDLKRLGFIEVSIYDTDKNLVLKVETPANNLETLINNFLNK